MGGFLSGFGEGLQKSAALEQAAQIAKKKAMVDAQLELASHLIKSDNPDIQAQGFAIYSDPSHPFSLEKPHPNLEGVQNVLQALGPGAATKSIVSGESPAGMVGKLSPDNSLLVQNGVIGDQGLGEPVGPPSSQPPSTPTSAPPAPAPPLPPQPAAMTTNPPATQGGQISPVAAAPPPPPAGIAPAPAPPAAPDEMSAAIQSFAQAVPPRPQGIDDLKEQAWYAATIKHAETLARVKALQAAGASKAEIAATLGGHDYTQVATTGMRETGKDADREAKKALAGELLTQRQRESDAKIALYRDRLKQDWAKHTDAIEMQKQRLAKVGSGSSNKAEIARLTKLQQQGEKAIDGATEGISGIENLRLQYKLYTETPFGITTALDKAEAWNRYAKAVSSEGARMSRAMTAMTLPGNRGANEARVKAMEKELASLWAAKDPAEGNYRIDNIEHLIRTTEEQLRANIEQLAANPIEAGKSVLPPPRPPKDLSGVAGGPGAPHAAPAQIPPGAKIAKNPKTGQRIYSTDGGKSWLDASTGEAIH